MKETTFTVELKGQRVKSALKFLKMLHITPKFYGMRNKVVYFTVMLKAAFTCLNPNVNTITINAKLLPKV